MKQQTEDSEWEGFQHQPQTKPQKTMQPFNLPTLSKTLNPTIKLLDEPKTQYIEEKQQTTQTQTTKQKKQTISFVKNYPRIPIIRPKEDFSKKNDGVLLYRGFQPSFSDRYFKNQQDNKAIGHISNRDNLVFDSRFESGNLNTVYKNKNGAYDLYMRVDTNTQGHLQWFYFKVKNEKPQNASFTIFRFKKKISLYQRGMKPYIKSKKDGTGWRQSGYNIHYCNLEQQEKSSKYYYLTFQYNFTYQNDQVYFAACPPYSYSLLMNRLTQFSVNPNCQVSDIGETLGGLSLPLVTFGSEECKNYIVISARTHPGETSGSWVMDGIMSYLYSEKAEELLKTVTFKIIPMLNPDGVYIGNYRTGILGKDFNRCFNQGASSLIPEISQVKSLMRNLQKTGRILLYLDLHGHSIQRNSFIFGPQLSHFPTYFKQLIPDLQSLSTLFKQKSCKLKTRAECVETARGYFQNVKKIFALTIQNSLGLYESNQHTYAIPTDKWRLFGKEICQVLGKCIMTEWSQEREGNGNQKGMKGVISQLQMLNKKIIEKIERRIITQKSDPKDKEKQREKEKEKQRQKQRQKQKQKQKISSNKFLNKKRFQMMKWKKINQIRNQPSDPFKPILSINKKSRKLSQQIKFTQTLLKQQVQITQSHTTKHNMKKSKPLTETKQSQSKIKRDTKTTFNSQHPNMYFSMREVNESELKKSKEVTDDIKDMEIEIQSPLLKPKESISIQSQVIQQQLLNTKIVELDNLSNNFSESSDINDRENDSDDLEPQQIKSLFQTVQMINRNRVFQFQQEYQEKRVNKLKQAIQKRIHKQPSYHSVPQKMQVYNKYNQLKLSLSNKSQAYQFRKSYQQDKEMQAIKHKYRKTFVEHQSDNSMNIPTNPSTELPTLDQNTSSLLKNKEQPKDFKRPLIIPISRTPITNIYRGNNIVENSIKEEILIETTKRLEKLQHQSIFSSKPFQDTFLRNNKSKYLDIKRRV